MLYFDKGIIMVKALPLLVYITIITKDFNFFGQHYYF